MKRLAWHFYLLRLRLGMAGLSGLALLLAAVAMNFLALQPGKAELERLQAEIAALRSQPMAQRSRDPQAELELFYGFFPARSDLPEQLRTLYGLAADSGMMPERADYKLARVSGTPLWRYQASLPISADYASLRYYIAAVLKDLPNATMDDIELQRTGAKDEMLEARLRFTLYFRDAR